MKKSIGIITIYRKNYGAFLQAYALQQILIRLGFKPEMIRYDYYKDRTILGIPFAYIRQPKRFLTSLAVEIVRFMPHRTREQVFAESVRKHIFESEFYCRTYKQLKKNPPVYDVYLTGSDQVFNVELSPQALESRLLCFVKNGAKASYAASAGKNLIPESHSEIFKQALREFSIISVRENGLKQYFIEKFGVKTEQHIDPTFLLTKDEWNDFAEGNETMKGKYIFYYRVLPQEELRKTVRKISSELGLPVFVADGNDKFENQVEREGYLSPERWVGMLRDAAYVVTNSFHGAAFAINLEKRVSILIPPKGGERVKNIVEKCNLCGATSGRIMPEDVEEIYSDAREYFAQERLRAEEYLKRL